MKRKGGPYRAYLHLIPLKVFLRKGRQEENDLSLDYGMDVRRRRVVHVGRPGWGHRTPDTAARTSRRFGRDIGKR